MANNVTRKAFPTDPDTFNNDERVSFSKTSDTHILEAEDGSEWEWLARAEKWIPVVGTLQTPAIATYSNMAGSLACV